MILITFDIKKLATVVALSLYLTACTGGGGSSGINSGNGGTGNGGNTSSGGTSSGGGNGTSSGGDTSSGGAPVPVNPGTTPTNPGAGGGIGGGTVAPKISLNLSDIASGTKSASTTTSIGLDPKIGDYAPFTLDLNEVTSFQISSEFTDYYVANAFLFNPSGTIVASALDSPSKSGGTRLNQSVAALTYPTNGNDAAVVNGSYNVQVYSAPITSSQTPPTSIKVNVLAKKDPDLTRGTLNINFYLTGQKAQRPENVVALDQAIDRFKTIYSAIGVTLVTKKFNIDNPTGVIPSPTIGSAFYTANLGQNDRLNPAINCFVSDFVSKDATTSNTNLTVGILGVAGGVPGTFTITPRSIIAISLSEHAGTDGTLSPLEIELLAQTLAHESGHYLGLFHPVNRDETDPTKFVPGDPLTDTVECISIPDCVSKGLFTNLMFPVGGVGDNQVVITPQQGFVINLQPIVN